MNSKIFQIIFLMSVFLIKTSSSDAQVKKNVTGSWTFEIPYAPEGYTSGVMDVKKDSVLTTFTNQNYKIPSDWIRVNSDSLIFRFNVEGVYALFSLKILDNKNIAGKVVWDSGESQISLKKKE
jgi:hypothetical protein